MKSKICSKNHKASGEYNFFAEMLKFSSDILIKMLKSLNKYEKQKIPEVWKNDLIYPLHKIGNIADLNILRNLS